MDTNCDFWMNALSHGFFKAIIAANSLNLGEI